MSYEYGKKYGYGKRCPVCGYEIGEPYGYRYEITCPRCGAKLRYNSYLDRYETYY